MRKFILVLLLIGSCQGPTQPEIQPEDQESLRKIL